MKMINTSTPLSPPPSFNLPLLALGEGAPEEEEGEKARAGGREENVDATRVGDDWGIATDNLSWTGLEREEETPSRFLHLLLVRLLLLQEKSGRQGGRPCRL